MSVELRDYYDVLYTACCDACGRYLREGPENSYVCAVREEVEKIADGMRWVLDGDDAYCEGCWQNLGAPI